MTRNSAKNPRVPVSPLRAQWHFAAPESFFIGCRPTTGECVMSCPERNGFGMTDSVICVDDLEPVACFCPANSQGQ